MADALVSVVVPIYKTEQYLDRCILSVVRQTYENLEIILVDDGSPDKCPEMCDIWAEKDARIRVIHKENAGLGFARNTGIENATGSYICFVDSDDYLEENAIALCCESAEKNGADVVCFGNDLITQKGVVLEQRIPTAPKNVFVGEEIGRLVIPNLFPVDTVGETDWNLSMSACFSLFSMDMIRKSGWRFVSEREIISEDFYSVLELYRHVQKLVVLPQVLYHYTVNETSLTRTYRSDRYDQIVHFARELLALSEKVSPQRSLKAKVERVYLGLTIGAIKQIVSSNHPMAKKRESLAHILQDSYLQQVLRENDFACENLPKRLLYWALRRKNLTITIILTEIRNLKDKCKR